MAMRALKFRLDGNTYSLPITGNSNVGTYGTLIQRVGNYTQKVLLAPYKDTSKTVVYSNGMQRFYYSDNYPSIHCRKNNTNYSCCNNYQNYQVSAWMYDYTGGISYGMAFMTANVTYAENSFLGSSYNKYTYQTKLAPYGRVTPTRDGYIFKGWNTSPDDTGDAYKSTSTYRRTDRDATFYALWAKVDAGTYGGEFFWRTLATWFGGEPTPDSSSSYKFSNHRVTLTLGDKVMKLYPGTKFCMYVSRDTDHMWVTTTQLLFGYQSEPHRITTALVGWYNNSGSSGFVSVGVSNGWLTDGGPSS